MSQETKQKVIKISVTILIVISILFALMVLILRYYVEGETNLPFVISKIVVVSSVGGNQEDQSENKWSINVNQDNDIYLYIEKNTNYGKTEIIDEIKLSNFKIEKENANLNIQLYKPSIEENKMFENTKNNEINDIIFKGDMESNLKELKISNQGGLIAFRCANNNISKYISNDAEEVNYNQLLQLTNVNEEDLKLSVSFDIDIKIADKKTYQATVSLKLPIDEIVNKGTTSTEITDLKDIVFKII